MSAGHILYSTNTSLAFLVAEKYYGQRHFFWCSYQFDPRATQRPSVPLPPTASPAELYADYAKDVDRGDLHSPRIAQNRAGIIAGATAWRDTGGITADDFDEIVEIVRASQIQDFKPLLFVAPQAKIKKRLMPVPVSKRAHPLSQEFIAEKAPRSAFDVIILPWSS